MQGPPVDNDSFTPLACFGLFQSVNGCSSFGDYLGLYFPISFISHRSSSTVS